MPQIECSASTATAFNRTWGAAFRPAPDETVSECAERLHVRPPGDPIPGPFRFERTPYLREICDFFSDDCGLDTGVCQKSQQVGYTIGVLLNVMIYVIAHGLGRMIAMFPVAGDAAKFNRSKFRPTIEASPDLRPLVETRSRRGDNTATWKEFPGGWLMLVGSNSDSDVTQESAPFIFVEEPDSCARAIGGAGKGGDSVELIKERAKAYRNARKFIGGKPSIAGHSTIVEEMEHTDKRRWMVPCHHCGVADYLRFDQVKWAKDAENPHPRFGRHHPESAYYECPHCEQPWTNDERIANVLRGHWEATAPAGRARGWYLNELMSTLSASSLAGLAETFLKANEQLKAGDQGEMIVFYNSSLGEAYEPKSGIPEIELLRQLGDTYPAGTVPAGGLVLIATCDVQHDRLAVVVRAHGRGQESWLVFHEELAGNPTETVIDSATGEVRLGPVWDELDRVVWADYRHRLGGALSTELLTIDASDGQTSDAVYSYVRDRRGAGRPVIAIKGDAERLQTARQTTREIYTKPKPVDVNARGKHNRYGLQIYIVGTQRAKDVLANRMKFRRDKRKGPGVLHWYEGVSDAYLQQLTSEIRMPKGRGVEVWTKKAGRANEGWDCEAYQIHAARHLRLHLWREEAWAERERNLRQRSLLERDRATVTKEDADTSWAKV